MKLENLKNELLNEIKNMDEIQKELLKDITKVELIATVIPLLCSKFRRGNKVIKKYINNFSNVLIDFNFRKCNTLEETINKAIYIVSELENKFNIKVELMTIFLQSKNFCNYFYPESLIRFIQDMSIQNIIDLLSLTGEV
mgnify:FL=1